MKPFTFILTILTFFSSTVFAQENVSIILDKYFQSIGEQRDINRIQSIYSFANCTGPNGKYQTEIYSAKGSKTFFRQIRENKPDYVGIVNGDVYWSKGTEIALSDKSSAFAWQSHELQWIATHLTERFRDIIFVGSEDFAGKQAFKLSALDGLNKTAQLFFDKKTHLLLGIIFLNPFGKESETIRMEVNDWKKVGNFLLPSKVSFFDKQGKFDLWFHTIKINQINKAIFDIPEKINATKQLLELHELQRTAHFNRDAKLLVSILAEDFIEVRNGKINSYKRENLLTRFQEYFDAVTFIEWDDIYPPIIKVSDDATLAYILVNKRVKLINKENQEELTIFAWTATFQKINDKWLMTSMASNVMR